MKKNILITVLIGALILGKFWIGFYTHDEFGDKYVFLKHRPIWKTYFYSPQGMSDLKITEMSAEKQTEQVLFDEFIHNQNLSN